MKNSPSLDKKPLTLEEKRALVKQLLQQKIQVEHTQYPLSYGQQALWFIYQNAPESAAYNEGFAVRIVSEYEVVKLRKTFQRMLNRHAILRTRFFLDGMEPKQQTSGYQHVDFTTVDASGWTEEEFEKRVHQSFAEPFNLEAGNVFRVRLFQINNRNAVLLMSLHHIVCDGLSINLLINELVMLYLAELNDEPPILPKNTSSYEAYINAERDLINSKRKDQLVDYWKTALDGNTPVLDLPTRRPAASNTTASFEAYKVVKLSPDLSHRLQVLAKANQATLFSTMLAAYQILLSKYSGQSDISTGTPAAGRTDARFSDLVGYFTNPVVIRSKIQKDSNFKDLLQEVQANIVQALEHQELPFAYLVEQLQLGYQGDHNPLFQTLFLLQTSRQYTDTTELLIPDNTGINIEVGPFVLKPFNCPKDARFDLSVEFIEGKSNLTGIFRYNPQVFDPELIEQMTGHYENLLTEIVAAPETEIFNYSLLNPKEADKLFYQFNKKSIPFPKEGNFIALFEQQVASHPNVEALRCYDRSYTYAQVNQLANHLAQQFIHQYDVQTENVVALSMERSEWLVIGMLGIFKAGGVYLPVEPNLPSNRIRYMLEETRAKVILTADAGVMSAPESFPILKVTDHTETWLTTAVANPPNRCAPDSLAYIIYTSGSTGKPKGAMIEHLGMLNHLFAKVNDLHLDENTVMVQNAGISFDISVWQAIVALLVGGRTIVYPQDLVLNPRLLLQQVITDEVTVLQVVPSYLVEMLEIIEHTEVTFNFQQLTYLVATGEALKKGLTMRWFAHFPKIPIVNAYGPTEASDDITHYIFTKTPNNKSIPIGKPVQNMDIYILDEGKNICPLRVKGDIYVAGIGVGRGYFNDKERTKASFIENPFAYHNYPRMYRTGDTGCYLPDGNIEFFGRKDYQVKISGYRIELGEIEEVLTQLPSVKAGAVMIRENDNYDKLLCACVVPQEGNIEIGALQKAMSDKLPAYMIPTEVVQLEEMPLTRNGKIDRKLLETMVGGHRKEDEDIYVAPETETETSLQKIWQEVLQLTEISTQAEFFSIGGFSLKAIRIQAHVYQKWGDSGQLE